MHRAFSSCLVGKSVQGISISIQVLSAGQTFYRLGNNMQAACLCVAKLDYLPFCFIVMAICLYWLTFRINRAITSIWSIQLDAIYKISNSIIVNS